MLKDCAFNLLHGQLTLGQSLPNIRSRCHPTSSSPLRIHMADYQNKLFHNHQPSIIRILEPFSHSFDSRQVDYYSTIFTMSVCWCVRFEGI